MRATTMFNVTIAGILLLAHFRQLSHPRKIVRKGYIIFKAFKTIVKKFHVTTNLNTFLEKDVIIAQNLISAQILIARY